MKRYTLTLLYFDLTLWIEPREFPLLQKFSNVKKLFHVKRSTPLSAKGTGDRGWFIYDKKRKKVVSLSQYRSDDDRSTWAKNWNPLGAIHKDGVKVWEDGKCKVLTSKRAVAEHAARNGLVMGGDDLEQEARHNKARLEREDAEKTNRIVEDAFERAKCAKNNNRNKRQ